MSKVRQENRELEKKLKQFKDVDFEHYKKLETELSEIKKAEALKKEKEAEEIARKNGEWETQKQTLLQSHQEKLEEITKARDEMLKEKSEQLEMMEGSLKEYLLSSDMTKAISEAEGNFEILEPHVKRHLAIKKEENNFVVRVVDQDGNIRLDSEGNPMSSTQLVSEMRELPAFKNTGVFKVPEQAGGSGSQGNKSPQTTTKNPFSKEAPNYTEQAKLFKKDPVMAERLRKEAGA